MKKNPLFVDSTKLKGDLVVSEVTLTGLLDSSIDEVRMNLMKQSGEEFYTSLFRTLDDESVWKGLIRLHHEEEFVFKFIFYRNGEEVSVTELTRTFASYSISYNASVQNPQATNIEQTPLPPG